MGRPPSITKEEVVASARAVFREKGIAGTTADIAKRCGVSEATLFRRYPSKIDLFRAAMVQEELPAWVKKLEEKVDSADLRGTLLEIGKDLMEYYRKWFPLWIIVMANPTVTEKKLRQRLRDTANTAIEKFFAAQIRKGRLREQDPMIAALIIAGSIVTFSLIDKERLHGISDERFLRSLVDLICEPSAK